MSARPNQCWAVTWFGGLEVLILVGKNQIGTGPDFQNGFKNRTQNWIPGSIYL